MPLRLPLEDGALFTANFRVLRPLSEGGMGQVYVIEQLSTGERRALKLMQASLVADPKARERFAQEARVGAQIRSEHVIKVIDAGVEDGTPWLAMELLEGLSLDGYAASLPERRVQVGEVQQLFRQLCHGLGAAHRQNIVHRDLKPENLFRAESHSADRDFLLKILDFGIAKIKREADTGGPTAAIGSPLWMAPEQLDNDSSVSPATDVWALGLIAFWLLTGKSYWVTPGRPGASMAKLITEIVTKPFPTASERAAELDVVGLLPPWFDAWFARCVARDQTARFASADEAYQAIEQAMGGRVVLTPTPGSLAATSPPLSGPISRGSATPATPATPLGATDPGVGSTVRLEPSDPPARPEPRRHRVVVAVGLLAVLCVAGAAIKMALRPAEEWPRGALPIGSLPERVGDQAASAPPASVESPWGRMLRIEGGSFSMGSLDGDPDERPPHAVTVATFELDETEVTVAAYEACVAAGACTRAGQEKGCNSRVAGHERHPINCVDVTQAAAFCQNAKKRLPTEEEWEFAARGGSEQRPYAWGSGEPTTQACWNRPDSSTGGTCVVGAFPSGRSRHGLLDLGGNVWEWTASLYTKQYTRDSGYPAPVCPPGDACGDRDRVARGGGWSDGADDLRGANRSRVAPAYRSPLVGLRCAHTP
jgi:formylglycine-generating enzyme required for sulfatase activity